MKDLTDFVQQLNKIVKDEDAGVDILSNTADVAEWLSTGCLVLDYILGEGIPVGRIVEIFGDSSSGKSLIAAQIAAYAQEEGYTVLYIDTESAISKTILEAVGVDVENILYTEPDTVEQVFKLIEGAIDISNKNGNKLLVIWDTIAATATKSELEADYGSSTMGIHARLLSQGLRKLNHKMSKSNVATVFINQERDKIGVMFGEKTTTFGGRAVEFYSSVRIKLDKSAKIKSKDGKRIIGARSKMTCVKNKVAPPFREANAFIYFGSGISDSETTFEHLKNEDVITGGSGGIWTIYIDGEPVKFKTSNWEDIYEEHYDDIVDMLLGGEDV